MSQDASREAMVEVAVRWVAEHRRVDRAFIDWADHDPDHWSHGRGPWISEFDGGLVAASPISEGADVTGAMVLWSQDGSDTIAASDARLILHRASVWLGSALEVTGKPRIAVLDAPTGSDIAPGASQLAELKDVLVTAVAHELRTPLSTLTGGIELLLDEALGPITDEQRTMLERMWVSASRLGALADNTRELSEQRMPPRVRSDEECRTDLVASVATVIDEHDFDGRQVVWQPPAHQDRPACIDEDDVRMNLDRLLDNAIKFSPRDSQVTVSVSYDDGHATVAVQDEGEGVEAEELVHLTSTFFRTASARRAEAQGAGLGLSVVKVLVESWSGTLGIQSTPKTGTRVTVRLPLAGQLPEGSKR